MFPWVKNITVYCNTNKNKTQIRNRKKMSTIYIPNILSEASSSTAVASKINEKKVKAEKTCLLHLMYYIPEAAICRSENSIAERNSGLACDSTDCPRQVVILQFANLSSKFSHNVLLQGKTKHVSQICLFAALITPRNGF